VEGVEKRALLDQRVIARHILPSVTKDEGYEVFIEREVEGLSVRDIA
jgi:hypothetical protein